MSQIFFKRCDRCGRLSEGANLANPPGWHCMADMMHGTLASVDLCAPCLQETGMRGMLEKRVRDRAVGVLKKHFDREELASLDMAQLVEKIEAGDYDRAFAQGDGINLDEELPQLAEIVEGPGSNGELPSAG